MDSLEQLHEELKKLGVASVVYDSVAEMEEDMIPDGDDEMDYEPIGYNFESAPFESPVIGIDIEKIFANNIDDVIALSKFNDSFNRNLQVNLKLENPLLTQDAVESLVDNGIKPDSVAKKVKAVIKGTAMSCGLTPKFG